MKPGFYCVWCIALMCGLSTGCSSLGLSLYPTGHFFTDRAEAVVAASPASAPLAREQNKAVVPTHFLQPGDVLLIEPVKSGDDVRIPADQTVLADGSVDLGIFGRVVLAGLSIEGAELLIEQTVLARLPSDTELVADDIDVNVRVIEAMDRYYVLGEVNSPGAYSLRGFETVLDGILEAGGLTSKASTCDIILARPSDPCECRVTLPICYREITQIGDTTTNYQLRPGDRIYVATRSCTEEMMFWRADQSCEKCDRCQKSCGNPSTISHRNAMSGVVAMAIDSPSMTMPAAMNPREFDSPMPSSSNEAAGVTDRSPERQSRPKTFPELMQTPEEFSIDPPATDPPATGSPAMDPPALDGELDLDIVPHQSRRFEPMWLK